MQITKRQRIGKLARGDERAFLWFIAPWLVGFLLLTLFPMLYSLYLSLTNSSIGNVSTFVGLANYQAAFTTDPQFLVSVTRTLEYMLKFVPLSLVFCLSIAMMLNQKVPFKGLFRVAFYIPSICAGVAVILLWGWILNPSFGLLNLGLARLGIEGPGWLGDPKWSMSSIVLINLWSQGNMIIIFLAGLQDIPESLYESANIDGANWRQKTLHITLPTISPSIFFNLILSIIAATQMFSQVYILTSGGPINSTYVYMLHIFNNAFKYGKMGYACALGWILLMVILIMTLLIFKSGKHWVHYAE